MKRKAFTLVELLAVIAVISVLVALLMPVLRKVRVVAVRVACMNNLKQFHLATVEYSDTNGGYLIPWCQYRPKNDFSDERGRSFFWYHIYYGLTGKKCGGWAGGVYETKGTVFYCDAADMPRCYRSFHQQRFTYAMNWYVHSGFWKYRQILHRPSECLLYGDNIAHYPEMLGTEEGTACFKAQRHDGSGCFSYADGHAKSIEYVPFNRLWASEYVNAVKRETYIH